MFRRSFLRGKNSNLIYREAISAFSSDELKFSCCRFSFLNGYWDRLSLYVAGLFGIFFLSEVMVAISLGIPKPPSSPKKEQEQELAKPVIVSDN